ncbi:Magnesium transporter NIPA - like 3 [Theobroma cacao]|nr:Magnesium transporter NIPA - like 3 [Theobroma cacao]
MNHLNKALDTFNTAVVSPIYYVMFTPLTILASVMMFKNWDRQNPTQIITEMCGFELFFFTKTKDMVDGPSLTTSWSFRSLKHEEEDSFREGIPLKQQDSLIMP